MRLWRRLLLMVGVLGALAFGAVGLAGTARTAGPIEGKWRSGGHVLQLTGSLGSGFTVTAAESWTINRVCTVAAGTLLARYTPKGGGKYEVRWLNVWVPADPDAPGAEKLCEFVFDGGPETVTITASANSLTISNCGGACSVTGSFEFKRVGSTPTKTPPTTKAPSTRRQAAYALMKSFISRSESAGFSKAISLGDLKTSYRGALARVTIRIDPTLDDSAKYDPATETITFKKDPLTIPPGSDSEFEETVWHEVTHRIEHEHGDTGGNRLWAERNTEYMTRVADDLQNLEVMEQAAKRGAPVALLRKQWSAWLRRMDEARTNLPETKKYPPDLEQLRKWFGFHVNPDDIRRRYLTGKALPGPAGARLREALLSP